MDFGTLKATVLDRISMASDDPAAASVGGLVNEALHELEAIPASGWPWMRSRQSPTLAPLSAYSLMDIANESVVEVVKILSIEVFYQGSYFMPMQFVSAGEAAQDWPSNLTGIPEAWYAEGDMVYVFPTPDTATSFRTRYVFREPDLTLDADVPQLPTVFHSAIVESALALYYELLQDTAKLQATQARVDRWIKKMETYGPQTATSPRVQTYNWYL